MKLREPNIASRSTTRGFTIVEVLVALTITLIMMGAWLKRSIIWGRNPVRKSRSRAQWQVRATSVRLRDELRGSLPTSR